MKQKLAELMTFVAIFFVGDRLLSYGLESMLSSSRFRYSTLYDGRLQADVLILGNSRAVNSFYAPAIQQRYDASCFNLGYNGMSPDVALALLLDYLERNPAPKLLIVEATCVDNESACIANFKPFWHRSTRLSNIADREFPDSLLATRISRLYSFNCEMYLRALTYRLQSDQTWINRYAIDEDLLREARAMQSVTLPLPTDLELATLHEIASVAAAHQIDCRIVIAPYLPAYCRALANFDDWKKRLAAVVDVVDLSTAVADTALFADRLHTNYAGRNAVIDAAATAGVFRALEVPDPRSE